MGVNLMARKSSSIILDVGELLAVCIGLVVLSILFAIAAIVLALITFWYISIPAGICILYYYFKTR